MKVIMRIVIWFNWLWSRIYRWLLEPSGMSDLKPYSELIDLSNTMYTVTWVADGIRQMWDATGSPEHFQYLIDNDVVPPSGCDCDEFAVYGYAVLTRYPLPEKELVEVVGVLTVSWWKPWFWFVKKPGGHHVCLIKVNGKFAHVGNWGLHRDFTDLASVIKSVLKDNSLIGWHLWQYPSTMLMYDTKIPTDSKVLQ